MDLDRGTSNATRSNFESVRPNAGDYTEDYKNEDRLN